MKKLILGVVLLIGITSVSLLSFTGDSACKATCCNTCSTSCCGGNCGK